MQPRWWSSHSMSCPNRIIQFFLQGGYNLRFLRLNFLACVAVTSISREAGQIHAQGKNEQNCRSGEGKERCLSTTRDYKRLDEDKFRYDIETTPFHVSLVFDDEDDISWAWQHLIDSICNEHAPLKQVKIWDTSARWITNGIRYEMNWRYKLFKQTISSRSPKLW